MGLEEERYKDGPCEDTIGGGLEDIQRALGNTGMGHRDWGRSENI